MPKHTRKTASSQSRSRVEPTRSSVRTRNRQQPAREEKPKPSVRQRKLKQPALAFLARSQDEIEADPNKLRGLSSLPKELLKQIAGNLPLASVICFTLSCKEAAEVVGTQSWVRYKKEKQWSTDRMAFCELLVRDWGNILECCPQCNALHPPLQPARSHRETKLTKCCFGQDAMIDYLPQDASHGFNPVFVHIAGALKMSEDFASKYSHGILIDTLSGDFTITKNNIFWRLKSTGQRIGGNLIVTHVHTLQNKDKESLRVIDLLALPIRLCPHQSTTFDLPERSRYIKGVEKNGSLLTHVITSAFPAAAQANVNMDSFKRPMPSEQEQMSRAQAGEAVQWRCRSCPTKYQVHYSKEIVTITSWHYFGRDLYHASKYWKWLVRRAGTSLGPEKRNDEWWSPSRTVPDFVCEPR